MESATGGACTSGRWDLHTSQLQFAEPDSCAAEDYHVCMEGVQQAPMNNITITYH